MACSITEGSDLGTKGFHPHPARVKTRACQVWTPAQIYFLNYKYIIMPPISQYPQKWRNFKKRNYNAGYRYYKPLGFGTRPKFMSRGLAQKRKNQVSSKVFYFKRNGIIQTNLVGNNYTVFRTREINIPATTPVGWAALKTLYEQYRVLSVRVSLYPSNVGVEPDSVLIGGSNALLRGDTCVWSDQRWTANNPQLISQVINNASAKMINSRRPYSRVIYRPTGHSEWGDTQSPVPDSWDGSIEMLINNATPQPAGGTAPVLWYYTVTYKILVRGRIQV